ncbi:cytochrome P450 93B2-like [Primulina eburnea]|uniref:cytochrome P450 93B2-like n=1 Tax=Primulina eburnea TaxID=1245227 RepID=UPI003C6C95A0
MKASDKGGQTSFDFFTAGTDTTAIAVEWSIAELLRNTKVLKKAQEEIDNVVGPQRLLQESDAPKLPYIMAISRKSVSDRAINGYMIRAQTLLFVNIWSIGRDPKYWERPMDFRPERFLDPGCGSIDVKGQNFELMPFGTGRRGCPGMLLAIQELVSILGAMVQFFDLELPDGSQNVDMTERAGLTAPRAYDLFCRGFALWFSFLSLASCTA